METACGWDRDGDCNGFKWGREGNETKMESGIKLGRKREGSGMGWGGEGVGQEGKEWG